MGNALTAVPLAALLAAAPVAGATAPTPLPSPTDSPLREIARVRATTPFCKTVLEHALSGIAVVLDNDARLAATTAALRRFDRESNSISISKGQQQLLAGYVAVREAVVSGRHSVSELKSAAKNAPTDAQKTALVSLANAVDGALMQQKALAERVAASVLRDDTYHPFPGNAQAQRLVNGMGSENRFSALLAAPGPDADLSGRFYSNPRREADEIERFMPRVAGDEAEAAARIDPAFESC